MLYRFKSAAAGDVLMLQGPAERVLGVLGKAPAAQGIFDVEALPGFIAALKAAIDADEASSPATEELPAHDGDGAAAAADAMPLRRRAWPLLELLQHAQAAGKPVVWGV